MVTRRRVLASIGAGGAATVAGCLDRLPGTGGNASDAALPDAFLSTPGLQDAVDAASDGTVSQRSARTTYFDPAGLREHAKHVSEAALQHGWVGGFLVSSDAEYLPSADRTVRTRYVTAFEDRGASASIAGVGRGEVDAAALRSADALEDAGETHRGYDLFLDGDSTAVGVREDAVAVGTIATHYGPGFERPSSSKRPQFALAVVRHAIDHAETAPSPSGWIQTALDRCGSFHHAEIDLTLVEAADATDLVTIAATEVRGEESRVLLCDGYPSASALQAEFERDIAVRELHARYGDGVEVDADVGDTTAVLSATVPTAQTRFAPEG